jgi:hypothetical protein
MSIRLRLVRWQRVSVRLGLAMWQRLCGLYTPTKLLKITLRWKSRSRWWLIDISLFILLRILVLNFGASGRYARSRCCRRRARDNFNRPGRNSSHLGSHGLWLGSPPHTKICKRLEWTLSILHWVRTVESAREAVPKC